MSHDSIQYFFENTAYFEALWSDLAAARFSIYIEVYKIEQDVIGNRLQEVLIQKAREGVRVKIAVDGIGSIGLSEGYKNTFVQNGVGWRMFHPLGLTFPLKEYLNRRDHRKMIIIDSEVGYIGSSNFALNNWRDTQARITGTMIAKMVYHFMRVTKDIHHRSKRMERFTGENDIVTTRNMLGRNHIRRLIHRYMRRSQKLIAITTAYFVPDVGTIFLLIRAVKRGVTVKIITNSPAHIDVPAVSRINRPLLKYLIKSGVKIYYHDDRMIHAKTFIFDNSVATFGSSNINYRSFFRDLEMNVFVRKEKWIAPLSDQFDLDLAHSRLVSLEDLRPPSWYRRIVDGLLYLIRSFF